MCGAVATFACLDATGKYLLRYMDPLQIVWARYFGAFLLALCFSVCFTLAWSGHLAGSPTTTPASA